MDACLPLAVPAMPINTTDATGVVAIFAPVPRVESPSRGPEVCDSVIKPVLIQVVDVAGWPGSVIDQETEPMGLSSKIRLSLRDDTNFGR